MRDRIMIKKKNTKLLIMLYRQILLTKSCSNSVRKFLPSSTAIAPLTRFTRSGGDEKFLEFAARNWRQVCLSPKEALDVTGSTLNAKLS